MATVLVYAVIYPALAADIPGLSYKGDQAIVKDENGVAWWWNGSAYALSGSSGGGTVAAPVWSTSASQSVGENTAFSLGLSTDVASTFSIVGGADQSKFSISGSTLSMAAKDYEAPTDADANNAYVVTVRATRTSDTTKIADRTFTVTVTDTSEASAPPSYTDSGAALPGIVYQSRYVVGTAMVGDAGAATNSPNGWAWQWYRNSAAISGATSQSYTPVTADGGQLVQLGVTPSNSAGSGAQSMTPSVYVNAS